MGISYTLRITTDFQIMKRAEQMRDIIKCMKAFCLNEKQVTVLKWTGDRGDCKMIPPEEIKVLLTFSEETWDKLEAGQKSKTKALVPYQPGDADPYGKFLEM